MLPFSTPQRKGALETNGLSCNGNPDKVAIRSKPTLEIIEQCMKFFQT